MIKAKYEFCEYCDREITNPARMSRDSRFCSNFCEGTICDGIVGEN